MHAVFRITLAVAFFGLGSTGLTNAQEVPAPSSVTLEEAAPIVKQLLSLRQRIRELSRNLGVIGRPPGLAYTCKSEPNECDCIGAKDCVDLRDSNDCSGDLQCGLLSCKCTWH